MIDTDDTEDAIARYRAELEAEADLAHDDLAELADHMRLMIADLRASGASAAQAIATARIRLGEPKLVAREHVRVRSPFGVRLSRARAISAAALLAAQMVIGFAYFGFGHPGALVELGLGSMLAIGLAARLTWARAAVMGAMGYGLMHTVVFHLVIGAPPGGINVALLALSAGTVVFVMPWRRDEIGLAGTALALLGVMYAASNWVLGFELSHPGATIEMVAAWVAMATTVVAGAGLVMRARWAAVAATISCLALALATRLLLDITFRVENAAAVRVMLVGTVGLGAATAGICAVLAWRVARSRLGSLRGIAI